MSATKSAVKPLFKTGATVRVVKRPVEGHCRTPWYLRGKSGVVVGVQGVFADPERLAYHKPGLPAQILYKVRFLQSEIWPRYPGPVTDHLEADIYEYWLQTPKSKEHDR